MCVTHKMAHTQNLRRCGFINAVLAAAGDMTDGRVRALLAAFMALEARIAK